MVKSAPEENPGTRKLTGTFTAPPPNCIGEPYVDALRSVKDVRSKGKQLSAGRLPSHAAAPDCFSLVPFLYSESKDPYEANIKYTDLFKNNMEKKKNGFLTSDFPKRDEFSNTIRTEQLREVLRKEARMEAENRRKLEETRAQLGETSGPVSMKDVMEEQKTHLYDVVFRQIPTSLKHNRDDRQSRLFYASERERLKKQKQTTGKVNLTAAERTSRKIGEEPKWVNITLDGRNLTVLVDSDGNVLGSQAAETDLRTMVDDIL